MNFVVLLNNWCAECAKELLSWSKIQVPCEREIFCSLKNEFHLIFVLGIYLESNNYYLKNKRMSLFWGGIIGIEEITGQFDLYLKLESDKVNRKILLSLVEESWIGYLCSLLSCRLIFPQTLNLSFLHFCTLWILPILILFCS